MATAHRTRERQHRTPDNRNRYYVQGNTVRKFDVTREMEHKPQPKVSNRTRKNRDKAKHMSAGYVLFLCAALVASGFILVNYIGLQSDITNSVQHISRLEKELNDLKLANDEEYSRITSSVDLEEIKSRFGTSEKSEEVEMPDVAGMSLTRAKEMLSGMGLDYEVTYEESSEYEEDIVIGSNIKTGRTVATGTTVKLTVSAGREGTNIPDVSGKRSIKLALNKSQLMDASMTIKKLELLYPDVRFHYEKKGFLSFLIDEKDISASCKFVKGTVTIKYDGTVVVCAAISKGLGNIYTDSLNHIYETIAREIDCINCVPSSCQGCHLESICRGGCKSHSYICYEDYSHSDDCCYKELLKSHTT